MNPKPFLWAITQLLADAIWAKWTAYVKGRGGYKALIQAEIEAQEEYRDEWALMTLEQREAHRRELVSRIITSH